MPRCHQLCAVLGTYLPRIFRTNERTKNERSSLSTFLFIRRSTKRGKRDKKMKWKQRNEPRTEIGTRWQWPRRSSHRYEHIIKSNMWAQARRILILKTRNQTHLDVATVVAAVAVVAAAMALPLSLPLRPIATRYSNSSSAPSIQCI